MGVGCSSVEATRSSSGVYAYITLSKRKQKMLKLKLADELKKLILMQPLLHLQIRRQISNGNLRNARILMENMLFLEIATQWLHKRFKQTSRAWKLKSLDKLVKYTGLVHEVEQNIIKEKVEPLIFDPNNTSPSAEMRSAIEIINRRIREIQQKLAE
eukprot:gnl/Chilomastix_cuspidata/5588.p2 GENE.gnl/Chilomastix_cuspidata/5588~~gnl/Chilomastix_cuspidata/5588.p2  ORF type:complete len:157 (+),score=69.86 gnl/Chilomastix_cuspidata/5588:21-491(+)